MYCRTLPFVRLTYRSDTLLSISVWTETAPHRPSYLFLHSRKALSANRTLSPSAHPIRTKSESRTKVPLPPIDDHYAAAFAAANPFFVKVSVSVLSAFFTVQRPEV